MQMKAKIKANQESQNRKFEKIKCIQISLVASQDNMLEEIKVAN